MRIVVTLMVLFLVFVVGGLVVVGITPIHPQTQAMEQKIDDSRLPR